MGLAFDEALEAIVTGVTDSECKLFWHSNDRDPKKNVVTKSEMTVRIADVYFRTLHPLVLSFI
ncbi:hypothetical protein DSM106972_035380 [Dulcicalothrix desertica PCC 7102]|uniref:Uncharacterized protein n=1 Tax=Dulcicalothrix desertica PCC 7102 TaxID=232991 RepID=A0A3S1J0E9_9CYAN|nr:hypothetical protein DSM106972_035380 [Dulcicalothrix desertica PCC 7102]BDA70315.1 hypothetical protein CAL7716_044810 [Calothrix sp. PCC 7716]GJD21702.1 hypothetical protein RIVM261_066580 [Rivularia sp. IAM M-261]